VHIGSEEFPVSFPVVGGLPNADEYKTYKASEKAPLLVAFHWLPFSRPLTLALQKSRMPQMQGVPFDKLRGEAVVVYADPFTTQQMLYHRLSRRVNNIKAASNGYNCF
jgi:hypothetical protein